ncbi:MAG: hypothetical protein ACKO24_17145 [Leptolyngbyaceae cyanobacterium]
MTYQQRLNPWVINRLLPNLHQTTVSRFRRRNEAESYLRMLQQTQPQSRFAIVFEVGNREYASQS